MKTPKPPKPPLGRYINGADSMTKMCPKCDSSLKHKYLFFKTDKCIHPKCENYYGANSEKNN